MSGYNKHIDSLNKMTIIQDIIRNIIYMIQEIKKLRVKIDGLSQLVKELRPINESSPFRNRNDLHLEGWVNSKEIDHSYDSLILGKAWLGKILQELGEESLYKNDGKRKDIKDIEPTADKDYIMRFANDGESNIWKSKSHIEKVDWLREEIKKVIEELPDLDEYNQNLLNNFYDSLPSDVPKNDYKKLEDEMYDKLIDKKFIDLCYQYLSEARFWLGFELGRIRESNDT